MWKASRVRLSLAALVVATIFGATTTTFGFGTVAVPSTKQAAFGTPSTRSLLLVLQQQQRHSPQEPKRSSRKHSDSATRLWDGLITFDLDDTLFPVGPVVADASQALFRHMQSCLPSECDDEKADDSNNSNNINFHQEEYSKTAKQIRKELQQQNTAITYTELRKRAIRRMLENRLPQTATHDVDAMVGSSYQVWEDHRHTAAEVHLYSGTIPMLRQLRTSYPGVVLAAITNGKGDPTKMESLREFFEFTVSGEDDDVFPSRKPSKGIYRAALERYRALANTLQRSDGASAPPDPIDSFCWIHIGDDLANDVGGSARCGAKAIWLDMEDHDDDNNDTQQPVWSTATPEELERRRLMDEKAKQYVSKRVTTLQSIPSAVEELLAESN